MMKSSSVPVITIDGPASSGKGTIAQIIASQLGYHYLDSGALYRLTGYALSCSNLSHDDEEGITQLAQNLNCRFENNKIFLNNEDVTEQIRSAKAGEMASIVGAIGSVRRALLGRQLAFRQPPGLVADGRDMGTVIFPDANIKFFLTSSVAVRAQRRYKQLLDHGFSANIDDLLNDLIARDKRDSQRKEAPLVMAKDAILIDSSHLTIDETVASFIKHLKEKGLFVQGSR